MAGNKNASKPPGSQMPRGRPIDANARQAWGDLHQRFQIVRKSRANVWLVVGVTLFVLGFLAALALVVSSPKRDAYNTLPFIKIVKTQLSNKAHA